MAQLIDLKGDFDNGSKFLLETSEFLAGSLGDEYRVIVKYDMQPLEIFADTRKNIVMSLSREIHDPPKDMLDSRVHFIFHNYAALDHWGYPIDHPKVFPLPLGNFIDTDDEIPIKLISEREYDFCFIGQLPHTGTRDKFKRCLDAMLSETGDNFKSKIIFTDGFGKGLPHKEYLQILNNSKLCLCPCGATSEETFRFFESLMMGAFPLVERLPKFWYYEIAPFFNGRWEFLNKAISESLNFIHNIENKHVFSSLASYNMTVLDPKNLSKILKSKIEEYESSTTKLQDSL
jgi:hypothetical protein